MAKILVLYYSSYGHIETMAEAVAEGARKAGAHVDIKRVPETAPAEVAKAAHFKLEQTAPIAHIEDLANYDGIIVGAPTRFGRIPGQMAAFLDQAGGLWMRGAFKRQSRWCIHLDRRAARRPRSHTVLADHQPAAFRHDHRRPAVQPSRADDLGRNRRRQSLWRHHHCRRHRRASTQRIGSSGRAPSRRTRCHDREEVVSRLESTAARLPRAGAAARADNAGARAQRVGYPGDVQHLRGRADGDGGLGRDLAIATAAAAGLRDRGDDGFAGKSLRIERR